MTGRDPRPPCLQILVARFGCYDLITAEAWAEYDADIARWRVERLAAMGVRPIGRAETKERRRRRRREGGAP